MKEKAFLIIMSHLSDAQQLSSFKDLKNNNRIVLEINFAKFIIMQTKGDLMTEIDPDEMWKKFLERN